MKDSLTPYDLGRIEENENAAPHRLYGCRNLPPELDCPACGDNRFDWWTFRPGTGVVCINCRSEIIVYERYAHYYASTGLEDTIALHKAVRREKKLMPKEESK